MGVSGVFDGVGGWVLALVNLNGTLAGTIVMVKLGKSGAGGGIEIAACVCVCGVCV